MAERKLKRGDRVSILPVRFVAKEFHNVSGKIAGYKASSSTYKIVFDTPIIKNGKKKYDRWLAGTYLRKEGSDGLTTALLEAKRFEVHTGTLRFGDDNAGVFIRGDNALVFAHYVEVLLERSKDIVEESVINKLLTILKALEEPKEELFVQQLKPFPECVKGELEEEE